MNNKQRGNALGAVVALVFILMTLMAGLHHQQSVARAAVGRAEGRLQTLQAVRYEMGNSTGRINENTPPWLLVSVRTENDDEAVGGQEGAESLFEREGNSWSGLANVAPREADRQAVNFNSGIHRAAGHEYSSFSPNLPGAGDHLMVQSDVGAPAAYAAGGNVELDQVVAWQNPGPDGSSDPLDSVSGRPTVVAAGGNVKVTQFDYGQVYANGDIQIDSGMVTPGLGTSPMAPDQQGKTYHQRLMANFQSVTGQWLGRAWNKSAQFTTAPPSGGWIYTNFTDIGSTFPSTSVRIARDIRLPVIPSIKFLGPMPIFVFHHAYSPDSISGEFGSDINDMVVDVLEALAEVTKAVNELKKAREELADARRAAAEANWAAGAAATIAVGTAEAALLLAESAANLALDILTSAVGAIGGTTAYVVGGGATDKVKPSSRHSEQQLVSSGEITDEGRERINYNKFYHNILQFAKDLIAGDFEATADNAASKAPLAWFGVANQNVTNELKNRFLDENGGMRIKATVNVPAGRSLQLDGDYTIEGGLWLQRGSSLVVNGDLTVTGSTSGLWDPKGRVFLEEGASLYVTGDFACDGSDQYGSVLVGFQPGQVHGITSAILVGGSARIPHGVYPGISIPDLGGENFFRLIYETAPNASKMDGPFHTCKPFMAKKATKFGVIMPVYAPVPMPFPMPGNEENLMVLIYRALSQMHVPRLNYILGENFYTHSDWWGFGAGTVPMIPATNQLDRLTQEVMAVAPSIPAPPTNAPAKVRNFKTRILERQFELLNNDVLVAVANNFADTGINLVAAIVGAVIPGGNELVEAVAAEVVSNSITTALKEQVNNVLEDGQTALDITFTLNWNLTQQRNNMSNIKTRVGNAHNGTVSMNECPGALIYAQGTLRVGPDNWYGARPKMATGMFAAGGDLTVNTDWVVGSLFSNNGSIKAHRLLYFSHFTRASLVKPRPPASGGWKDRGLDTVYGATVTSSDVVSVGSPVQADEAWPGIVGISAFGTL